MDFYNHLLLVRNMLTESSAFFTFSQICKSDPFGIGSVMIFRRRSRGNAMQCVTHPPHRREHPEKSRVAMKLSRASPSHLPRYSRRLLVSGIARSGHHKSIRGESELFRGTFTTHLAGQGATHRLRDMTRCIKIDRVARSQRGTARRHPFENWSSCDTVGKDRRA